MLLKWYVFTLRRGTGLLHVGHGETPTIYKLLHMIANARALL